MEELITPPPLSKPYNPHRHRLIIAGIMAILLIIAFFIGLVVGLNKHIKIEESSGIDLKGGKILNTDTLPDYLAKDVNFKLYWKVWDIIKTKYIDREQIPDTQLFYGSLNGIVNALKDPYSVFLEPQISKEFTEELSGKFEGIGAEIGIKDDRLTIIAPLPDSPAFKGGIKAQDKVLAIDGKDTIGISLDEALHLIRGEKGTKVTLTIGRERAEKPFDITITRDTIDVKSVSFEMKNKIAYIRLTHFNEDTGGEFQQIVNDVLTKAPQGIILDLRNNAGGYLETAIEIAGYWVKNGENVVKESFGNTDLDRDYVAHGYEQFKSYSTVVLINSGSASASEIVAGALQDYGLAKLIGETTFGKGSVQELQNLSDGSSVKITVARWLTPQGRSIDQKGIEPDIEVELTEEDYNNNKDSQLDKALELLNQLAPK